MASDSRDGLNRNSQFDGEPKDNPHATTNTGADPHERKRSRKSIIIAIAVAAIIILFLVIFLPIYFTVIKKKNSSSSSSGSNSGSNDPTTPDSSGNPGGVVSGGNGSTVVLEDGSTFMYLNSHGGHWYYDVNDPFNNGAKAQEWSPGLNETFRYGVDKIRGAPAPFQAYQPSAIDEYTLHTAMAQDQANGGLEKILEEHYKTFITEQDFAEIAAAGLNYLRLPIPYWAIDTIEGEPFLPKVAWKYFLKAIQWARKYGLRINLDLHTIPGSQNGWNHSGKFGDINFLRGTMGMVNAQRALDYIRIMAEFISQPEYRDVVTMFSPLNEAREVHIGKSVLDGFYAETYRQIRAASGTGEGQGPWIAIGDGQMAKSEWAGYLRNADRLALDNHPYIAFNTPQTSESWGKRLAAPCQWGKEFNDSMKDFGLTISGEWSLAINDCGLWVNGVKDGIRYEGTWTGEGGGGPGDRVGSCQQWTDWQNFSDQTKKEIKDFMMASMDGLQNYFFWTWKIGPSRDTGKVETPAWSYKLGVDNGWIPRDPREADGFCGNTQPWNGELSQGSADASPNLQQYTWPPSSIQQGGPAGSLYSYTRTGAMPTATGATLTVSGAQPTKTVDVGDGWNSEDRPQRYVAVEGCSYPDPWNQGGGGGTVCGSG
ncbi:hypothetical protein PQX77_010686 [Marasmius sp. AFHP31]|nr:hypothetical protein PQX77_010686 [Marasmius sp. AFHP31]